MLQGGVLARCPSCRNTFSTERAGHQVCPVCGQRLLVPEPDVAPLAPLPESRGTPWERRGQLGFLRAWIETTQQALLEPGTLFRSARLDRGGAQLGFAVLTSSVFAGIGQLLGLAARGPTNAMLDRMLSRPDLPEALRHWLEGSRQMNTPAATLIGLLFLPVGALVFTYLNAAVTHLFVLVLRQARRGFAGTFAACAYSYAPLVLLAIPGCGFPIAVIWLVVLTGIGLKEIHGIKPAGAAAAVVAPYLLLCCMVCATAMMVGAVLRSALQ